MRGDMIPINMHAICGYFYNYFHKPSYSLVSGNSTEKTITTFECRV